MKTAESQLTTKTSLSKESTPPPSAMSTPTPEKVSILLFIEDQKRNNVLNVKLVKPISKKLTHYWVFYCDCQEVKGT